MIIFINGMPVVIPIGLATVIGGLIFVYLYFFKYIPWVDKTCAKREAEKRAKNSADSSYTPDAHNHNNDDDDDFDIDCGGGD